MKTFQIIISITIAISLQIYAETRIFKDYNFSIDTPESWIINPKPENSLHFVQSPDGSKLFIITASKIDANNTGALSSMVNGWKKSASSQGVKIDKEETLKISNVPFKALSAKLPDGNASVTYMGVHNDIAYSILVKSSQIDPASDDEYIGIINSFKFLDPKKAVFTTDHDNTSAYKFGRLTGTIAFVAFIIGAIIIMITKKKKTS